MNKNFKKLPILYSFRRCPYAIRARMAIKYSGVLIELREITLRDKPKSMLDVSPKGTVPVLILQDGKVIDESRQIIDWALSVSDPDKWLPQDSKLLEKANELIASNDSFFKSYLDKYKYSSRYPENPIEFYRKKCEEFLNELEERLRNNKYLLKEQVSFADIAIFPFIRQFVYVDKDWFDQTNYINLKKWLNNFLQSNLFESVMNKYSPWKEGDKVTDL